MTLCLYCWKYCVPCPDRCSTLHCMTSLYNTSSTTTMTILTLSALSEIYSVKWEWYFRPYFIWNGVWAWTCFWLRAFYIPSSLKLPANKTTVMTPPPPPPQGFKWKLLSQCREFFTTQAVKLSDQVHNWLWCGLPMSLMCISW